MRKYGLIITMIISLMALCGCSSKIVSSMSIKEGYEKSVYVGSFNPGDYTIVETYKSGREEEIEVTREMIPDESYLKTFDIGRQEIEVVYNKKTMYISIEVKRLEFDCEMPDGTFAYDGKPHSLEISGYYPSGTEIIYPRGESFTNVGTYTVEAVMVMNNYETKRLQSTLTITSADYDLDITFTDKEFIYDGEKKTLGIEGTLLEDVRVSYQIDGASGNSAVSAGEYNVTAYFTSTNQNYNPISPITRKLTIKKAAYNTDEISIGTQSIMYTGEEITWKVVNTLPSWIAITYIYLDENGDPIEEKNSNSGYSQMEIGYYTFKVSFTILNSNYEKIDDMTFEVCIYEEKI